MLFLYGIDCILRVMVPIYEMGLVNGPLNINHATFTAIFILLAVLFLCVRSTLIHNRNFVFDFHS